MRHDAMYRREIDNGWRVVARCRSTLGHILHNAVAKYPRVRYVPQRCTDIREGGVGGGRRDTGQNEEPVGNTTVCNPHLAAVNHVIISFLDSVRLGGCYVRACARLCDAVRCLERSFSEPPEVLLLQLFAGTDHDWGRGQACRM